MIKLAMSGRGTVTPPGLTQADVSALRVMLSHASEQDDGAWLDAFFEPDVFATLMSLPDRIEALLQAGTPQSDTIKAG